LELEGLAGLAEAAKGHEEEQRLHSANTHYFLVGVVSQ
jgi:hypothetical protein